MYWWAECMLFTTCLKVKNIKNISLLPFLTQNKNTHPFLTKNKNTNLVTKNKN
jgi:hypothetical protein